MSNALVYLTVAFAALIVGGLVIFTLPRGALLVVLILLRTVASVGASSAEGDLLPGGYISGAVAIAAVVSLILPSQIRFGPRLLATAFVAFLAFVGWTVITVFYFGLKLDYLNDLVRVASLICIILLAYRVGGESPHRIPRLVGWVVGVPAVLLVAGYSFGLEATMNLAGRATGTFSHANQAGAYFAVGILACVWAYWRSSDKLLLGVALLALLALLLTQSLGAIAAVAAGAVVMIITNTRLTVAHRYYMIVSGMILMGVLFFIVGASSRLSELQGVDYGDAESDNSLDWRFANWRMLLEIWWERSPILGLGFGSTSDEIQPLGTAPHSIFIQLLVETGIFGTVVALIVSAILLSAIFQRFRSFPHTASAMLGVCTVVVVHGAASNWLGYSSAQYLALFVIGAMLGVSRLPAETIDRRDHINHQLAKARRV